MEPNPLRLATLALLGSLLYSVRAQENQLTGLSSSDSHSDSISSSNHQPQKRSALLRPNDDNTDVLVSDGNYLSDLDSPYLDDPDKRGSLFRFGKRGGSLFRFGKRGSLLRFGKRGTLFRFGKRGGALFRFGRSNSDDAYDLPTEGGLEDKRTLFRFGKRSDLDLLSDVLAQYREERPAYFDDAASKRAVDSFHWGSDSDQ